MNWHAVANHLWQSTASAIPITLLALAFRRHGARVRHGLWLAASLKFLIPFSLFFALGSRFESHTARPIPRPVAAAIAQVSEPFRVPGSIPARRPMAFADSLFLPLWFAGALFFAARWWRGWRRVRSALRQSSPVPIPAPVPVRSSPARLEPGIFGLFRPVLLVPDGIVERLTPAQFQAILAHESCHVRRRDNWAAALHMFVEAIFWFHPLVWWIGARLVAERELACDEEVLLQGSKPADYAAGILSVCKFYLESPLPCASGVTGANLTTRIEAIMSHRIARNLQPSGKVLLATAAVAACLVPIAIGMAQTQSKPLRFEVASIKPVKGQGGRGGLEILRGGELRMGGTTLEQLVAFAYDVRPEQIAGGPTWSRADVYNIAAKPEPGDAAAGPGTAPGSPAWTRLQQRLQSLLTERFHLEIHRQSRPAAIYALTIARGGFKLQPVADADNIPAGTTRSPGQINGRAGSMRMLATVLSGWLHRPVEDRTGLDGRYTYKLEYAQDEIPADADPAAASGPSVFAALREQLGLQLESTRGSIETIVIDRAQRPSAN